MYELCIILIDFQNGISLKTSLFDKHDLTVGKRSQIFPTLTASLRLLVYILQPCVRRLMGSTFTSLVIFLDSSKVLHFYCFQRSIQNSDRKPSNVRFYKITTKTSNAFVSLRCSGSTRRSRRSKPTSSATRSRWGAERRAPRWLRSDHSGDGQSYFSLRVRSTP